MTLWKIFFTAITTNLQPTETGSQIAVCKSHEKVKRYKKEDTVWKLKFSGSKSSFYQNLAAKPRVKNDSENFVE